MVRLATLLLIGAPLVAGIALAAGPHPAALAPASPGLWEIDGVPGAKAPARECVGSLETLARFEHRSRACSQRVLTDAGTSAVIEYRCGASEFGRSKLTLITPRSLRIETQGISGSLPFNYTLQARRVGDCQISSARH